MKATQEMWDRFDATCSGTDSLSEPLLCRIKAVFAAGVAFGINAVAGEYHDDGHVARSEAGREWVKHVNDLLADVAKFSEFYTKRQ